jgi:LacI family transcriptional regulator
MPAEAPVTDRRKPTIADVAAKAGVSVGTVSNVMANAARVRPETRRRVESAIAALGYRPNRVAQSLSRQRTHLVGALVPEVTNPFFAELVQGIERSLSAAQYSVVFATSHEDVELQRRYIEDFHGRRVDGVVLVVAADTEVEEMIAIAADTPVTVVDRVLDGWDADHVTGDSAAGMELAVGHLAQLGHRRFALINGEAKISTARERESTFIRAVAELGGEGEISRGSFTLDSGFAQAEALLGRDDPPTAIIAGNDLIGIATITVAAQRGISVPDELSVIGYDDVPYARLMAPALTTVRAFPETLGIEAARLLLDRLDGHHHDGRHVRIAPELVVRRSTGPARGGGLGGGRG